MGAGRSAGGRKMIEVIKKRKISVHNLDRKACEELDLIELLEKQRGIISAKIDEEKGELFVVYNLAETDYESIDRLLEKLGIAEEGNLWLSLKESFIRFAEENEKSNLVAHADVVSYSPMEEIDELLDEMD